MSATTKVVTGKVRFSYANVWEPRAMEGSDRAKYSVSILIPKTDSATLARVKEAIDTALKEGIAKLGGKIPPDVEEPPPRRGHRKTGQPGVCWAHVRQCQLGQPSWHRGHQPQPHHRKRGLLLWMLRPGVGQLLRLQHEWQ